VVCSACGFDNPLEMRFCGMCGTPMPHRPITAPGAQSTLNFTRIPVDSRGTSEHSTTSSHRPASLESARSAETQHARTSQSSIAVAGPQEPDVSTVTQELPVKELVPDVPLDEYIQKFRYEPPTDPTEITMRGDAPVATSAEPASPPTNPAATSSSLAATREGEKPASSAPSKTSEEDVDQRLGLEAETPAEARIARPRFLDINEPPRDPSNGSHPEATITNSGTSTIGGPSFLGLSDPPQTWAGGSWGRRRRVCPALKSLEGMACCIGFAGVRWLGIPGVALASEPDR
jgi:hypothetical protein